MLLEPLEGLCYHDVLKKCEPPKEIAQERKKQLKEAMKMVAAHIAKMMKAWEDVANSIFTVQRPVQLISIICYNIHTLVSIHS